METSHSKSQDLFTIWWWINIFNFPIYVDLTTWAGCRCNWTFPAAARLSDAGCCLSSLFFQSSFSHSNKLKCSIYCLKPPETNQTSCLLPNVAWKGFIEFGLCALWIIRFTWWVAVVDLWSAYFKFKLLI